MTELERMQVVIEATTKPLQNELKKVDRSLDGLEKSVKNTTQQMNKSFEKTAAAVVALGYGIKKAVDAVGGWINEAQSVNAQGKNLSRSLGASAEDFLNWSKTTATAYGISEAAAIQYGNTFSGLASGFAQDTKQVSDLTKSMLQTASVVASKTGRTMDDVLTRIQSGLWGNTKAIEDLNIFVNQSMITQTEAYKQIADGTPWAQLAHNQQQAILYYAILEQAQNRYGNSIDPAMRKQMQMQAQLANLKIALGNAFLPILNVVIPILQTFVKWIDRITAVIKGFFNFLFGGFGEASSSVGDIGGDIATNFGDAEFSADNIQDSLNDAAKASQKIKNNLASFDELNILSEPSANAGGGPIGGGGGGPIGGGGGPVDFGNIPVGDGIFGALAEDINKVNPVMEKLLDTATLLGAALLAFKAGSAIAKGLTGLGLIAEGNNVTWGLWAGAIAIMGLRFAELYSESEYFKKGVDAIGTAIEPVIQLGKDLGSQFGKALKDIGIDLSALEIDFNDFLITAGGIALLFTPAAPMGIALLGFEAITLAIRAIGNAIPDVIDDVYLLGEEITTSTKDRVKPLLQEFFELDNEVMKLELGNKILTDDDINSVIGKIQTMTAMIATELASDRAEELANLYGLRGLIEDEFLNELINDVNEFYDERSDVLVNGEARISEIMKGAAEENRALTKEEADEIAAINQNMLDVGVRALSETTAEYLKIMENSTSETAELSDQGALALINNARELKDRVVAEAEEEYQKVVDIADRQYYELGTISKEQYDEILRQAQQQKEDTIDNAEDMFTQLNKNTANRLSENTKLYVDNNGLIKGHQVTYQRDALAIQTSGEGMRKYWGDKHNKEMLDAAKKAAEDTGKIDLDKYKDMIDAATSSYGDINTITDSELNELTGNIESQMGLLPGIMGDNLDDAGGELPGFIDDVEDGAKDARSGFEKTFKNFPKWFGSIFTDSWKEAKKVVSNTDMEFGKVKTGVDTTFKSNVNAMIGGMNVVTSSSIASVDRALNSLRNTSIEGKRPFAGIPRVYAPQIPKLAVGTNYVQREGLAYIHEGEAVVPKKYNPAAGGGGGVEQIVLLQEQNSLLRQLLEKDSGVYLDGKEITDKTVKNIKQRERLTGKPVFGF